MRTTLNSSVQLQLNHSEGCDCPHSEIRPLEYGCRRNASGFTGVPRSWNSTSQQQYKPHAILNTFSTPLVV